MSLKYMNEEHYNSIEIATSYAQLSEIALSVLKIIPEPVGQVCGPITSGGRGSFEANIKHFTNAINSLESRGINIFSQMPFEDKMQELKVVEGYNWPVLHEFYQPIFESNLVRKLYFLPDWQESRGSCWEREQADKNKIEVIDLDDSFEFVL